MNADLVLGIDASTTAVTCVAFDRAGQSVASGRSALPLSNPEPLGYEQDAERWWSATVEACTSCLESVDGRRVVALAVAHQRETFVLTDPSGHPLGPALVWMDERCRDEVEEVRHEAEAIHQRTGKPLSTTASFGKFLWLKRHRPESLVSGFRFHEVHSFLALRLCDRFVSSVPSADPTGLVDPRRGQWDPAMLDLCGLSTDAMAELVAAGSIMGEVSSEFAQRCGLSPRALCVAGAGDGQAAALGVGLTGGDEAYLNLGTAVVSGLVRPVFATSDAFRTLAGATPGSFLLESDLKGGTFTLNWLAQTWLGVSPGDTALALRGLESTAASIPAGAEGLTVVPYWAGVMNPYWDDQVGGITVGWRSHHTPAHFYRAVLEGIAMEERLHLEGIQAAVGGQISRYRVTGGGAQSDLWCQILADVTGRPLVRAAPEATALGAAILAASAGGWFGDHREASAAMCHTGREFLPGPDRAVYERIYREVYARLYPSLRSSR